MANEKVLLLSGLMHNGIQNIIPLKEAYSRKQTFEGCLDDPLEEKALVANRSYRVMDYIMTKVWSLEMGLVVPRVEKWVYKPTILKAIENRRVPCAFRSGSPQMLYGVPKLNSSLNIFTNDACVSVASTTFVDLLVLGDEGEDNFPVV